MQREIFFLAHPYDKNMVTFALESGVDGIIAEEAHIKDVQALGRARTITLETVDFITLKTKDDETRAIEVLRQGGKAILKEGWEIIPVENIIAQSNDLGLEVSSLEQAHLACGILQRGVKTLVVLPEAYTTLKSIVKEVKLDQGIIELIAAEITAVQSVGLGHRVCVDTTSLLEKGQGMLVGNSSGFTFLVHAETEANPYVNSRPFRINAGSVHSYALLPNDRTAYLEELKPGHEVLVVNADGTSTISMVGRAKIEVRPLLLITAQHGDQKGQLFVQNAETIRMVKQDGEPVSVVDLGVGDRIISRIDMAGRHFGMRVEEDIIE